MFDQVFENLRKATETTVQMQQEAFKKWVSLWPGTPPAMPAWGPQFQQFQKKWAEVVGDQMKRQREGVEVQFKAGLESIEKAFQVGEAKNTEEFRAKMIELWKKCFESFRQVYEAQMRDFQVAMEKWAELMTVTT
jgi:hypothetical protein